MIYTCIQARIYICIRDFKAHRRFTSSDTTKMTTTMLAISCPSTSEGNDIHLKPKTFNNNVPEISINIYIYILIYHIVLRALIQYEISIQNYKVATDIIFNLQSFSNAHKCIHMFEGFTLNRCVQLWHHCSYCVQTLHMSTWWRTNDNEGKRREASFLVYTIVIEFLFAKASKWVYIRITDSDALPGRPDNDECSYKRQLLLYTLSLSLSRLLFKLLVPYSWFGVFIVCYYTWRRFCPNRIFWCFVIVKNCMNASKTRTRAKLLQEKWIETCVQRINIR